MSIGVYPQPDVLIIGAGPAGSTAALVLARAGLRVVLVDRHTFPRDKACGDALIPDALQALGRLGLRDQILAVAHRVETIRIYAPNGRHTTIAGECACLPRAVFDDLLRRAATGAGATFLAPARALAPIVEGQRVAGAWLEDPSTHRGFEIRAPTTLLATGAHAEVLQRFGMCLRSTPSATAARIYVRVEEDLARQFDYLCIAFTRTICPGYGWFFPGPDRTFNLGVGYVYDGPWLPRERNVRKLLAQFVGSFPPAAALMKGGTTLGTLKGAPLRTAMQGARLFRPGLLAVGEAAGLTYSFSGEGIGKAMQSGIMAAESLLANDLDVYGARLSAEFGARFRAYSRLQSLMAHSAVANALVWRANAGHYVHSQLEALFAEKGSPDGLLSVTGILRALLS